MSGETSAGALQRVDWLMRQPVAVLILETGANDGLRGLDPDSLRANIDAIVRRARRQAPPPAILLLGMEAPPNLGSEYTARFRAVYQDASRELGVPLVPFLLAGVGGVDSLNQADGIHPTAAGQRQVAALVWEALEPLLRRSGRKYAAVGLTAVEQAPPGSRHRHRQRAEHVAGLARVSQVDEVHDGAATPPVHQVRGIPGPSEEGVGGGRRGRHR